MNNAGMPHAFIQEPGFEMSGDNGGGETAAGQRERCDTDARGNMKDCFVNERNNCRLRFGRRGGGHV